MIATLRRVIAISLGEVGAPLAELVRCSNGSRRIVMPEGDKNAYTDKQRRKPEHIAQGS
jgi:hypothetical protein